MSANETLVRRLIDAFNASDEAALDAIVAANHVHHDPANPGTANGPQGQKELMRKYKSALPDLRFTIDAIVEQGDLVAVRWTSTGTHSGPLEGIAATGRGLTVTGMDLIRISGGKAVETWVNWDALGLMRQLGVMTAAAAG